jgi:hypothetical protein
VRSTISMICIPGTGTGTGTGTLVTVPCTVASVV